MTIDDPRTELDDDTVAPASLLNTMHPHRVALANEVHARPSQAVVAPCRATYVAKVVDIAGSVRERAHLAVLCDRYGVVPPAATATHFSAALGALRLTWERHGEFSGYTFLLEGASITPFGEPPIMKLPSGWLAASPGRLIVAAHANVVAAPGDGVDAVLIARHFAGHGVMGSDVGERAGAAYTDFHLHDDGFTRFLLVDRSMTSNQAGRMLQRLFEIETYRTMALLALPIARQQAERLGAIEAALATVTANIAAASDDDEALLHQVTRLSAEVENELATSQFRFGACRAYAELVTTRIADLREDRLKGIQPISEFMTRRFAPAVATCAAVSNRLHGLSERVARASALLSTRVGIARERQNQALLESMDRRAKAQLRLQMAVEGLSAAAIVYYAAGLVAYMAKALHSAGLGVEPDLFVGASLPILAVLVVLFMRRAHRAIAKDASRAARR